MPVNGAPADLPASAAGLQAGYLTYPKNPVKSVSDTPGRGGDVTVFTQTVGALPPPVDQNPAWREINRQLNANMKMDVVINTDYYTRIATVIAGGDLPDLISLQGNLTIAALPQFLKSSYADLTPYLGGDAIKDYPNLADLPTSIWAQCVYNRGIYGVPVVRPFFNYVWFYNQSWFERVGATQPTNADDFKRLVQDLTHPQSNQWGLSAAGANNISSYGLQYTGRGDVPFLAMFGTPNNWAVDASGKFTKDIETEQFRAAVGYVRDLYASGVFYPDIGAATQSQTAFLGGKIGVITSANLSASGQLWDPGMRQQPPLKVGILRPFSHDGGTPTWHQFQGLNAMTAIKQAPPERIKELLRILNYMAAPFGTQEATLLEYGVQGTDFNFDDRGNPTLTTQGAADVNVGWKYLTQHQQVLFDPLDPEFAKVRYADEQALVPYLAADPTVGLHSATDLSMGGQLTQKLSDGLGELATGRSPLSDLDRLLSDWRSAGGDQMRVEYQQAYTDSKA
jgi:putative aldouronate transport system substrate-binding protein